MGTRPELDIGAQRITLLRPRSVEFIAPPKACLRNKAESYMANVGVEFNSSN